MQDFARWRDAFSFASPRNFDFLDCETKTSKYFEFEPKIWLRAMRMS